MLPAPLLPSLIIAASFCGAEEEAGTGVAGIPDFWLHVLQSHKGWSEEVKPGRVSVKYPAQHQWPHVDTP